jgi:cell division protein FtsQ
MKRVMLGRSAPPHVSGFTATVSALARAVAPRRPMLALTLALILVTLLAAVVAGGRVSATWRSGGRALDGAARISGFGISSVKWSGNVRTPSADIRDAVGFEDGVSIFSVDIRAARARLMALPWVADAQIRRQFPSSISVTIIERLPFALWQTAQDSYVVERTGRVIAKARASDYPRLPVLLGDGAPEAGAELVDAIAPHKPIAARIKAMQRVSDRRWNLLLDDGVVVELPEAGWQHELDELEHLIVYKGVLERDISEIDMRSPDNLFFRLRGVDRQQTARGDST